MLIVFNDHAQQGEIEIKTKLRGHFRQYKKVYNMFFCFLFSTTKSSSFQRQLNLVLNSIQPCCADVLF